MNRKQIERFIKKVSPLEYPIEVHYYYDNSPDHYFAEAHHYKVGVYKIYFNKHCLKKKYIRANNGITIKECILHEVGHFINEDKRPLSKCELEAQLWAIDRAKELGMSKIQRVCIKGLIDWQYSDWKNGHRIYRMAYNKAMENKKLVKEYGLI